MSASLAVRSAAVPGAVAMRRLICLASRALCSAVSVVASLLCICGSACWIDCICRVLAEPGGQAVRQRSVFLCRDHCDLAVALRLAVVLAHRRFMCGKFTLNLRALVAGCALQIKLRIGEFVGIKPELSLGDFEIVSICGRAGAPFFALPGRALIWPPGCRPTPGPA